MGIGVLFKVRTLTCSSVGHMHPWLTKQLCASNYIVQFQPPPPVHVPVFHCAMTPSLLDFLLHDFRDYSNWPSEETSFQGHAASGDGLV